VVYPDYQHCAGASFYEEDRCACTRQNRPGPLPLGFQAQFTRSLRSSVWRTKVLGWRSSGVTRRGADQGLLPEAALLSSCHGTRMTSWVGAPRVSQ
jgi:hypothetical protein